MLEAAGRLAVAALVLAVLPPPPARGQDVSRGPSGRIAGHVVTTDGEGLADVSVTISGLPGAGVVTAFDGAFALDGVRAGWAEVRFTRLGYATYSRRVQVEAGATARLDAVLSEEAIELAPIDVSVSGRFVNLETNGFYRRSERGFGRQYSRDDLDALHILEVSDAVRDVSGLVMQHDPYMANRVVALRSRNLRPGGAPCALTVFVDGVRTLDPNLNQVPQDWIVGMEVYLGAEAPAQYRLAGGCGVVLLWTKDGRS